MTNEVLLPWPPSTNRIWRSGKGKTYRSGEYLTWRSAAAWTIKAAKLTHISSMFEAEIVLYPPTNRLIDLDNRIKAILDAAQDSGVITNDGLCRRLVVGYGPKDTPHIGALLILKAMPE